LANWRIERKIVNKFRSWECSRDKTGLTFISPRAKKKNNRSPGHSTKKECKKAKKTTSIVGGLRQVLHSTGNSRDGARGRANEKYLNAEKKGGRHRGVEKKKHF